MMIDKGGDKGDKSDDVDPWRGIVGGEAIPSVLGVHD